MELNKEKPTYYLSKIPTITGLHPKLNESYIKKVGSFPKRKFLESQYIPDERKIALVKYFDPEAGKTLETGVKYAKNIDKTKDKVFKHATNYITPYINSSADGKRYYDHLQEVSHFGGKKRKSRKNTRKSRKNTRKSKKHKRTRKHKY